MRIFKFFVLFCFLTSFFRAKCEVDTVLYHNSVIIPLSNFINSNVGLEKFRIGYLLNFNEKIGIRIFLGFNLNQITTSKPMNTDSDMEEIREYYFINPGIKIGLSKTRNLLFYCNFDAAFSYDLKKTVGFDFSSVTKSENIYDIVLGSNLGIEFFVLNNLSISIESGISYHTRFGNKSVSIGEIIQKDKIPSETNFGVKPFLNHLNISVYF